MLEAVEYLHRINLCHTDLKPENVLCTVPDYKKVSVRPQDRFGRRVPTSSSITVIDFGSATFEDQHHSSIVSTRHYRAPEIILGLGWSYPCDIWSLGCIFLELLTGDALYSTHDNHEHLVMIERTCGRFPGAMLKRAEELRSDVMRHFDASGRVTSVGLGRGGRRAVDRLDHVRSIVAGYAEKGLERAYDAFTDLVERMLALDPQVRQGRDTTRLYRGRGLCLARLSCCAVRAAAFTLVPPALRCSSASRPRRPSGTSSSGWPCRSPTTCAPSARWCPWGRVPGRPRGRWTEGRSRSRARRRRGRVRGRAGRGRTGRRRRGTGRT